MLNQTTRVTIGWTYSELAYEFNCHKSTIGRILNKGDDSQ